MRTTPVNQSDGPFADDCEPMRVTSNVFSPSVHSMAVLSRWFGLRLKGNQIFIFAVNRTIILGSVEHESSTRGSKLASASRG
jgi:hypothetical protein